MQTGNTDYIYKNDLDKACFQHYKTYGKYKDLAKKIETDKVIGDKAFKIASNPRYNGYQKGLASMVYKFFDKKPAGSYVATLANESVSNQLQLANELHKPIIRKLKSQKFYPSFNIWRVDLAYMLLITKYNKGIRYSLCAIDLFSKYAWVVPLKDKKGITIFISFQSILYSSKCKPNKKWVDQKVRWLRRGGRGHWKANKNEQGEGGS